MATVNWEFDQLLEAELDGRLDEAGRERLAALCAADPALGERARQERRLAILLGGCGPNHAPPGLTRAVLARLETEAAPVRRPLWRAPVLRWGFGLAAMALVTVEAALLWRQGAEESAIRKRELAQSIQPTILGIETTAGTGAKRPAAAGESGKNGMAVARGDIAAEKTDEANREFELAQAEPATGLSASAAPAVKAKAEPQKSVSTARTRSVGSIGSLAKTMPAPQAGAPESAAGRVDSLRDLQLALAEEKAVAPAPSPATIATPVVSAAASRTAPAGASYSAKGVFTGVRAQDGTAAGGRQAGLAAEPAATVPAAASAAPAALAAGQPVLGAPMPSAALPAASASATPSVSPVEAGNAPGGVPGGERMVAMRIHLGGAPGSVALEEAGYAAHIQEKTVGAGGPASLNAYGVKSLTSPVGVPAGRAPAVPATRRGEMVNRLLTPGEGLRIQTEPSTPSQDRGAAQRPVTERQVESAVAQAGGRILSTAPVPGGKGLWRVRCAMTESQLRDFLGRLERLGIAPAAGATAPADAGAPKGTAKALPAPPQGAFYQVTAGRGLLTGTAAPPAGVERERAPLAQAGPPARGGTIEVRLEIE
ncbi:MAG: hypothetical protein M1457_02390 [bacterium]|nr:hypothetical protein [bacterium]